MNIDKRKSNHVAATATFAFTTFGPGLVAALATLLVLPIQLDLLWAYAILLGLGIGVVFLRWPVWRKIVAAVVIAAVSVGLKAITLVTASTPTYFVTCRDLSGDCLAVDDFVVADEKFRIIPEFSPINELFHAIVLGKERYAEWKIGLYQHEDRFDLVSPLESAIADWLSDNTEDGQRFRIPLRVNAPELHFSAEVSPGPKGQREFAFNVGLSSGSYSANYTAWRDGGDGFAFTHRVRKIDRSAVRAAATNDQLLARMMYGDLESARLFLGAVQTSPDISGDAYAWDWITLSVCGQNVVMRGVSAACFAGAERFAAKWLDGGSLQRLTRAQMLAGVLETSARTSGLSMASQSGVLRTDPNSPVTLGKRRLRAGEEVLTGFDSIAAYSEATRQRGERIHIALSKALDIAGQAILETEINSADSTNGAQDAGKAKAFATALAENNISAALEQLFDEVEPDDEKWTAISEIGKFTGDELKEHIEQIERACKRRCTLRRLEIAAELNADQAFEIASQAAQAAVGPMLALVDQKNPDVEATMLQFADEWAPKIETAIADRDARRALLPGLLDKSRPKSLRVNELANRMFGIEHTSFQELFADGFAGLLKALAEEQQTPGTPSQGLPIGAVRQFVAMTRSLTEAEGGTEIVDTLEFLLGPSLPQLLKVDDMPGLEAWGAVFSSYWQLDQLAHDPVSVVKLLAQRSPAVFEIPTPREGMSNFELLGWAMALRTRAELAEVAAIDPSFLPSGLDALICSGTPPDQWALTRVGDDLSHEEIIYLIAARRLLMSCRRNDDAETLDRVTRTLIGPELLNVEL